MRRLSALLLTAALVASLAPLAGPAGAVGTFDDDDGNIHEENIEKIAALGITKGCNPPENNLYCPDDLVTRQQMASFLVRTFDLPPAPPGQFTDTEGSVHQADIDALSQSGITRGCNPPDNTEYCPLDLVTRGQMAAFMARGLGLDDVSEDFFGDDDDNIFELQINAIARVGITKGCNPPENTEYCPDNPVRRDEMASFLSRVADIVTTGTTSTTTPGASTSTTTTSSTAPGPTTSSTTLPDEQGLETVDELVFGTDDATPQTRTIIVTNDGDGSVTVTDASISGLDASHFSVDTMGFPTTLGSGDSLDLDVTFAPTVPNEDSPVGGPSTAVLLDEADLEIATDQGAESVPLFGLAHHNVNNHWNEPPLQLVFDALGYQVDVGWNGLEGPEPNVDTPNELAAQTLVKAGSGAVTIVPVARYSDPALYPFGWNPAGDAATRHQVGVIDTDQARKTFPTFTGSTSFDPGAAEFGIWVDSVNGLVYTEDDLNSPAGHRARVYPATLRDGTPIANTVVVCFEEAGNNDHQDTVFLVTNVVPGG